MAGASPARVTELRPLGEFATWRAPRAVGDHDLNSFRLRLDPVEAEDKLQPGMTVGLAGDPWQGFLDQLRMAAHDRRSDLALYCALGRMDPSAAGLAKP